LFQADPSQQARPQFTQEQLRRAVPVDFPAADQAAAPPSDLN
jgi:hypothetical protein